MFLGLDHQINYLGHVIYQNHVDQAGPIIDLVATVFTIQ